MSEHKVRNAAFCGSYVKVAEAASMKFVVGPSRRSPVRDEGRSLPTQAMLDKIAEAIPQDQFDPYDSV